MITPERKKFRGGRIIEIASSPTDNFLMTAPCLPAGRLAMTLKFRFSGKISVLRQLADQRPFSG
jgi:hypothetical protein